MVETKKKKCSLIRITSVTKRYMFDKEYTDNITKELKKKLPEIEQILNIDSKFNWGVDIYQIY